MSKTITIGNFKGGVGKTTTSVMLSYLLQHDKKKILLIDFDPQANASEIIGKTFNLDPEKVEVSLAKGIQNLDISHSIIKASDYLDLIPSNWDLSILEDILEKYSKKDRYFFLRNLIAPFKDNYDYIIIDTPPTLSAYTNNAILASDFVVMVLQTQQQAYSSSIKFINYLQSLRKDYGHDFELLGVIPYLVDKGGLVDHTVIDKAKDIFGRAMFHEYIFKRQRIKKFGLDGIRKTNGRWTNWDKDVFKMYQTLLGEMIGRIKLIESGEE